MRRALGVQFVNILEVFLPGELAYRRFWHPTGHRGWLGRKHFARFYSCADPYEQQLHLSRRPSCLHAGPGRGVLVGAARRGHSPGCCNPRSVGPSRGGAPDEFTDSGADRSRLAIVLATHGFEIAVARSVTGMLFRRIVCY
jgi:hypothetical protein